MKKKITKKVKRSMPEGKFKTFLDDVKKRLDHSKQLIDIAPSRTISHQIYRVKFDSLEAAEERAKFDAVNDDISLYLHLTLDLKLMKLDKEDLVYIISFQKKVRDMMGNVAEEMFMLINEVSHRHESRFDPVRVSSITTFLDWAREQENPDKKVSLKAINKRLKKVKNHREQMAKEAGLPKDHYAGSLKDLWR